MWHGARWTRFLGEILQTAIAYNLVIEEADAASDDDSNDGEGGHRKGGNNE